MANGTEGWTKSDLQVLYLKRNWEIIEVFKGLRARVPVIFSGTILAYSSFMIETAQDAETSYYLKVAMSAIVLILCIAGNVVLNWIHVQYDYTRDKIDHLYRMLDMNGVNFKNPFAEKSHKLYEDAPMMFWAGHIAMSLVGIICAIGFFI